MPLANSSFQTPDTLVGTVKAMTVIDVTEGEKTSLIEVGEPFAVQLDWQLAGIGTPVVRGFWLVQLFLDDIDGIGPTQGLLGTAPPIPIVGGISPLNFSFTFNIGANVVQAGLYQLSAAINHSPVNNDPNLLTEMLGFAESTPVKFTPTPVE